MSHPLERLWKDKMTVFGWTTITVNNVTKSINGVIATDIKCHYSRKSQTVVGQDGAPTLVSVHYLFCGLDTVHEGDEVIVTQHKTGAKISLTVGEGFPAGAGMQFIVKRSDMA